MLEAKEVTKGAAFCFLKPPKRSPKKVKLLLLVREKHLTVDKLSPLEVKVGDRILFTKYGGTEITTTDGEELMIMKEEDILAIVK